MRIAITIKQTFRINGLGIPVHGWYVCDYGIPLGPPHASEAEAKVTAIAYVKDISNLSRSEAI